MQRVIHICNSHSRRTEINTKTGTHIILMMQNSFNGIFSFFFALLHCIALVTATTTTWPAGSSDGANWFFALSRICSWLNADIAKLSVGNVFDDLKVASRKKNNIDSFSFQFSRINKCFFNWVYFIYIYLDDSHCN